MNKVTLGEALADMYLKNYCVAYIDILGARKLMLKNNNRFLKDLDSIYLQALEDIEFTNEVTRKEISVKIFSDNILITVPIPDGDVFRKAKIEKILNLTSNIYNNALRHGYLTRGSVTEGSFYKDDNNVFVYGKALIEAVEMEEKLAVYPRILVQEHIKDLLPQYLEKCNDGLYLLNCFHFSALYQPVKYKLELLKMLKKYYNDKKVMQKIMWAITYYNCYYSNLNNFGTIGAQLITDAEIDEAKNK